MIGWFLIGIYVLVAFSFGLGFVYNTAPDDKRARLQRFFSVILFAIFMPCFIGLEIGIWFDKKSKEHD